MSISMNSRFLVPGLIPRPLKTNAKLSECSTPVVVPIVPVDVPLVQVVLPTNGKPPDATGCGVGPDGANVVSVHT